MQDLNLDAPIVFINQRALYSHALSVVHCPVLVLGLALSVHTSPSHRISHKSFIFGINMHLCLSYMHLKHLVILTYGV